MMVVLEVLNYIVQWNQYLLALLAILNIGLLITLAIYYWKVGQFNHYQKGLAYLQSVNRADTTDAIPT
mgnify:FL=1